jgi:hypothetical protein
MSAPKPGLDRTSPPKLLTRFELAAIAAMEGLLSGPSRVAYDPPDLIAERAVQLALALERELNRKLPQPRPRRRRARHPED